jgi:nitroimidazol reductase NimA-like FMN-containing flavoprotein (pyridoxamine 5'-phosphate oxidase superfamily)
MPTPGEPTVELDERYSEPGATATPWEEGRAALAAAMTPWVVTLRPDGRPHATPVIAVWHDGALHFATGPAERKGRNLARDPRCTVLAGGDAYDEGLDVSVEGTAVRVTDEEVLRELAEGWVAKYGEAWRFEVRDGSFHHDAGAGEAWVRRVEPTVGYGFAKGRFAHTRWRFTA